MKIKIFKLIIFLLGLGVSAQAQEASGASGGEASGSGGTVAYSVGQLLFTTDTGASGTVSRGVQQTYEIFMVGLKETALNISLSVFPNPTADHLTLQIGDYKNENLSYQLFDVQGILLDDQKITSDQTRVNMYNMPSAIYFIKVAQENKHIQSFKIIKTN